MTHDKFSKLFEKHSNLNSIEFEDIKNKLSTIPQLHAFLTLNALAPSQNSIVSAADHDIVYLNYGPEDLAESITEDIIIELVACGVNYEDGNDYLHMYV